MTERGNEKSALVGDTYDPTQSHSFASFGWEDLEAMASYVLENHSGLMDEDLCFEVNDDDDLALLDEPTDLQWLLTYMELHYQKFNSHFEWEPAKNFEEKAS